MSERKILVPNCQSTFAVLAGVGLLFSMTLRADAGVTVPFDLNDGTLSGDSYISGPISIPEIQLSDFDPSFPDSFEIWFDFFDKNTGAKQHLELTDDLSGNPSLFETVGVTVSGPTTGVNFSGDMSLVAELTHVIGTLEPNSNPFPSPFADTIFFNPNGWTRSIVSGDLTDESFVFHDLHLDGTVFFLDGPDPLILDTVEFNVTANFVQIGTWPIPEPFTFTLAALALLSLLAHGHRRRRA